MTNEQRDALALQIGREYIERHTKGLDLSGYEVEYRVPKDGDTFAWNGETDVIFHRGYLPTLVLTPKPIKAVRFVPLIEDGKQAVRAPRGPNEWFMEPSGWFRTTTSPWREDTVRPIYLREEYEVRP